MISYLSNKVSNGNDAQIKTKKSFFALLGPLALFLLVFMPVSLDGIPRIELKYFKSLLLVISIFSFTVISKIEFKSFYTAICLFILGCIYSLLAFYYFDLLPEAQTLMLFFTILTLFSIRINEISSYISLLLFKTLSFLILLITFYFIFNSSMQVNLYTWNEGQTLFFAQNKVPVSIFGLYTLSSSIYLIFCLFWINEFFTRKKIISLLYLSLFIYLIYEPFRMFQSLQALLTLMLITFFVFIYYFKFFLKKIKYIQKILLFFLFLFLIYILPQFYEFIIYNDGFIDRFDFGFSEGGGGFLYNAKSFFITGIGFSDSTKNILGVNLSLGDMNQSDIIARFSIIGFLLYYLLIFLFINNNLKNQSFLIFPLFLSIFLLDTGHAVSRSIYFLPILTLFIISINSIHLRKMGNDK